MKIRKVYTVTDLGGGDGGKGGVVHKLCALRKPHTVIKVGGAQGSHGVTTASGRKFNFSQFGCGTFNGAQTFISNRFVVSPVGLLNEAHALESEAGVCNPLALVSLDGNALCTTPFHGVASRLKELARKGNPRGIVGVGVGEAYLDSRNFPELAIYGRDLGAKNMRDRLLAVRRQKLEELGGILETEFLLSDIDEVKRQIDLIRDDDFLNWSLEQFEGVARLVRVVDEDYLRREILSRDGVIVVESSHGILTDRYHGFHPHASRFRTLPETTWSLLRENDYAGDVVKLGVTRAYQIRHGAGPLVTESETMTNELLPHEVGIADRYRGKVRVGALDMIALRYALNVCGGSQAFDALAITWFDSVLRKDAWQVCDRYIGANDPSLFSSEGEILVRHGEDTEQLQHQERLTKALFGCLPQLSTFPIRPNMPHNDAVALCTGVLAERLGTPVRMISFGPTELDKHCF